MSSSGKKRPVLSSPDDLGEVFVVTRAARAEIPTTGVLASAADVMAAAQGRAEEIVAVAQSEASEILASASGQAEETRRAAHEAGLVAAAAQIEQEFERLMEMARAAARDGKAIHDDIVADSAQTVANAVSLAVRRLVAEYYEADPGKTAAICGEALRAAAGLSVIRIRVNEMAAPAVRSSLRREDVSVVNDNTISIGGCIVDLDQGTIDATLESRLQLLELGLSDRTGAAA